MKSGPCSRCSCWQAASVEVPTFAISCLVFRIRRAPRARPPSRDLPGPRERTRLRPCRRCALEGALSLRLPDSPACRRHDSRGGGHPASAHSLPRAASLSSLRVGDTRSGAPRGRGYSDSPLIKIMLQKAPTQSLFITGYLVSRLRVLVNSVGRPRVIPAPRLRPFIPMELLRRLACLAGGHGGPIP